MSDPTDPTHPRWLASPNRFAQDRVVFGGFALVLLVAYTWGLGSYGLYDPWETHYGEVARNMVETDNYIDPWWGAPWDPPDVKRERAGFYSKPPLIMWMMAAGMTLLGFNEWGVRLFFPLVALLSLLAIYLAVSRFYNRRAGLIAAGVTAAAPVFAFMSRQAVTDGPMVAIMTAGMMFLALGLLGPSGQGVGADPDDDWREEASPALRRLTLGLLLFVVVGQLWTILPMDRGPDVIREYPGSNPLFAVQWVFREAFAVGRGKGWAIVLFLFPLALWAGLRVARERRRRVLYIYLFYICCGLTVPAKGWLAWAPAGATIVGYIIVTWDWQLLKKVDVPGGLLLVFVTGHPWVIAMLGGHHPAWYDRFIIHDHRNRLLSGVHSIDDGGFEYFFQWIGYGLFPLVGLLPAAIVRVASNLRRRAREMTPRERFELMLFLWTMAAFTLFSLSRTKFHHYIFPAIPPMAILIGILIEDLLSRPRRGAPVLLGSSALMTFWVGYDLYRLPSRYGEGTQHLVNLFTYKYDREWPKYVADTTKLTGDSLDKAVADNAWLAELAQPLFWMAVTAALGMLLVAFGKTWWRRYGATVIVVSSVWGGGYALHQYLPTVATHWSQKGMWDAYYSQCTPMSRDDEWAYKLKLLHTVQRVPREMDTFPREWCAEPIVAFRTNWRGEAYYSGNTVIPAIEIKHLEAFLEQYGKDKPFFLFTERTRVKSELDRNLPDELKGRYREVFGDNLKFVLMRFDPSMEPDPEKAPKQKDADEKEG